MRLAEVLTASAWGQSPETEVSSEKIIDARDGERFLAILFEHTCLKQCFLLTTECLSSPSSYSESVLSTYSQKSSGQ